MGNIKSCEFNMDTGCVELCFADGGMIAIDCIALENEVADNLYERSNWIISSTTTRWRMPNWF